MNCLCHKLVEEKFKKKKKTTIENKNSLFPIVSFLWHIFASWWQKKSTILMQMLTLFLGKKILKKGGKYMSPLFDST
jgi:hypothetical protein